jgi:hypothetical protein
MSSEACAGVFRKLLSEQPAYGALHRSLASGFQQKRVRCSWLILIRWKPLILLKMPNAKRRIVLGHAIGDYENGYEKRSRTRASSDAEAEPAFCGSLK